MKMPKKIISNKAGNPGNANKGNGQVPEEEKPEPFYDDEEEEDFELDELDNMDGFDDFDEDEDY